MSTLKLKKCPICELNWIEEQFNMCQVCKNELNKSQIQTTVKQMYYNFKLVGEITSCRTRKPELTINGFKVYNYSNENIGIAFPTIDKRTPAYNHLEIYFYPEYEEHYGRIWLRIKSNKQRIPWSTVVNEMETNHSFEFVADCF